VEHVPIEEIAPDMTFRLRDPGDVSELATAIGRLGQLTPVELRPLPGAGEGKRFQVVAGFRRMEALRMLQRERVLARVHPSLPDGDAWALALAANLFAEPWSPSDLDAVSERVRAHLPWAAPALEALRRRAAPKAATAQAAKAPAEKAPAAAPRARPAGDPSSLARSLAVRAYELNGEVAAAFESWGAVPAEGRRLVLEQLRYLAKILPLLEKENR
jgi:ParB-like chromosome segregation protein Spo0J